MAGEEARIWVSARLWLGVVLILWVMTAGGAGYFLSEVQGLKETAQRMQAAEKEQAAREQDLLNSIGPALTQLASLQEEKLAWERLRREYEKKDADRHQRNEAVAALLEKAAALESRKDLYAAMKVYCEAARSDSNSPAVADGLKTVTTAVKQKQGKDEYIAKVRLYDFVAKFYTSMFDGPKPGVEFKLQNNGDRTLSRVTVTIYFQDPDGKTIHEQLITPVNGDSWMSPTVLRPGYIWQLERGKFLVAESVLSEWQPGLNAAYAKITDIEFAKE